MWANMKARFVDRRRPHPHGAASSSRPTARSTVASATSISRAGRSRPIAVKSRVQFPRMREIFFANEPWALSGDGDFTGTFHLFKGGHDLAGTFPSEVAGVYDYRFPLLHGSLHWTRNGFEVTDAGADLFGGEAHDSTFAIAPLGAPTRPTAAVRRDLRGRRSRAAVGLLRAAWAPLRRTRDRHEPARVAARALPRAHAARATSPSIRRPAPTIDDGVARSGARRGPRTLAARVGAVRAVSAAVAPAGRRGDVTYRFDAETIERRAEPVRDRAARTSRSRARRPGASEPAFEFHVTSGDWQESDQVLAGILTDFGARTGPVAFGGRGEFDGAMTGPFRRPRVEGRLHRRGPARLGHALGRRHAPASSSRTATSTVDGRARPPRRLRDPRRRPVLARLSAARRRRGDRRAHSASPAATSTACVTRSSIDDYPVSGRADRRVPPDRAATSADRLRRDDDRRRRRLRRAVRAGHAPSLRFDGAGVRLDGVTIAKSGGTMTGAAFVGWDSTYSFNADGRRIPVERIAAFAYPALQPSGAHRVHGRRQRHLRRAALRRARSGSTISSWPTRAGRTGHRHAGAARRRDQRRARRRVAAAGRDRHRAHRARRRQPMPS